LFALIYNVKEKGDKVIPVKIHIDDNIIIRNIESDELNEVLKCVNESEENFGALGRTSIFTYEDIEQRYLETLISSLEFFCGIFICDKLVGIIKGRIENKNVSEMWILSFLISNEYRSKGIGSQMLKSFENYFLQNYSTEKFCILALESSKSHRFWTANNYKFSRITNLTNDMDLNMMIFEKKAIRKVK
jgi:GNAT superfamily N-acetyltransferase